MMSGDVKTGYLFVADISGYTKFMADSELEHAKGILEDLFGAILPAINSPVQISGLLGDAVFAYVNRLKPYVKAVYPRYVSQDLCGIPR